MPEDIRPGPDSAAAEILALSDDGICQCEIIGDASGAAADFRVIDANPAFARITGIDAPQGRRATDLFAVPAPDFIARCIGLAQGARGRRFRHEFTAIGRDFDVFVAPLSTPGRFALTFRDITCARRIAARRRADLNRAHAMLVELNHRVMNSLGMISGIVAMEARKTTNPDVARPLSKVRNRVHALAVLYRTLNTSDSVDRVQAGTYLGAVIDGVGQSVADAARVTIRPRLDDIALSTRTAVPLGLILNELVTNALKYAFTDGDPGRIDVSLTRDGGRLRLRVADDGSGMGQGVILGSGAGSKLIEAFVTQIDGESRTESSPEGTVITVWFTDRLEPDDPPERGGAAG